jgi:hypothetical protein
MKIYGACERWCSISSYHYFLKREDAEKTVKDLIEEFRQVCDKRNRPDKFREDQYFVVEIEVNE